MLQSTKLRQVLLLLLLLSACEYKVTGYPDQPLTIVTCTQRNVELSINWVQDVDEASKACNSEVTKVGCAVPNGKNSEGVPRFILYMPQPRDFNDQPILLTMGHELCHSLGGKHQ